MRRLSMVILASLLVTTLLPATSPAADGVKHVVLCWLKEPGNQAQAAELIRVSRELAGIPGVADVAAGGPLPSERPVVDDSFDVGVVMTFARPEDLQAYLNHPAHLRRVHEKLQPLCGRVRVYDIRY